MVCLIVCILISVALFSSLVLFVVVVVVVPALFVFGGLNLVLCLTHAVSAFSLYFESLRRDLNKNSPNACSYLRRVLFNTRLLNKTRPQIMYLFIRQARVYTGRVLCKSRLILFRVNGRNTINLSISNTSIIKIKCSSF